MCDIDSFHLFGVLILFDMLILCVQGHSEGNPIVLDSDDDLGMNINTSSYLGTPHLNFTCLSHSVFVISHVWRVSYKCFFYPAHFLYF